MTLTKKEIQDYIKELKNKKGVRVYTPYKYFQGLKTKKDVKSRFNEILKGREKDFTKGKSYKYFETDYDKKGNLKKTKESKYTKKFFELYGRDAKTIKEKSKASGVPYSILKEVYDKGVAAWLTGHRVGAGAEQWGYARVHSFLTLGCTALGADFYLFEQMAEKMMKTANGRKNLKIIVSNDIACEKSKLKKPYYQRYNAIPYINDLRKKLK